MAKKKQNIPAYGTAEINGVTYFRTRITDADGKRVPIYASTCEELYKKEQDARQQVQDILFRKQNPTVEDYCERWLLMRSATVTQDTLRNYRREMYKYIVEPLGNLYLSDVTADDIKLALVPVSKRAKHTFDTVNMLIKSVFYSAERSEVIDYNPAAKISAKGGVPGKPMDALTDEQVKKLVDAVKGLPPYVFVMLGLYAGLRREESLALQWDCVFLGHADSIYFCPACMAGKPPERAGDLYRIKNSGIPKGYSHSKVFGGVPARGKTIFQICLCDFKS